MIVINQSKTLKSILLSAVLAVSLSACGGGSGGGSSVSSTSDPVGSGLLSGNTDRPDRPGRPAPNIPTTTQPDPQPTTQPTTASGDKTITFMHYNDLHAHLNPHPDRVADGQGGTKIEERGGIARAATLIKQIRAENPDSLLMNVGDTYHGGAEAWFTLGNAIVPPVNALGIDVGVPGNWDFGYSSTIFRMRYSNLTLPSFFGKADPLLPNFKEVLKPNFPNLAANMTGLTGREVLPATLVKDVNGVKVGFIGLTSDIVKFVYALLAPDFKFTGEGLSAADAEKAYRDLINGHAADLRAAGADIVVVMSELGIHKDQRLANIVNQGAIDVFFSAHTHEATFVARTSTSGALVVEAGNDGYLGRMDITVNNGAVTGRNWNLLPIDNSLVADTGVQAIVDKMRAPFMAIDVHFDDPMPNFLMAFTKPLDHVIGHSDATLDRRGSLQSNFNNAMTDILRHYSKTDLAMAPGFRFDSVVANAMTEDNVVLTGDITVEDVFRFFPMMFTAASGEVTGARLKAIIEDSLTKTYSPDVFKHAGGWLEGWSGLSLSVNLANPDGQRVVEMRLKDSGQLITDTTVVTVAGCKRPIEPRDMLCRKSGFSNVKPLINEGLQNFEFWTMIDFFIEGVESGVSYDATRRDIIDQNSTPLWPQSPFIQPVAGVQ